MPQEVAPSLMRYAWRKNASVANALRDGNRMKGLTRISMMEEVTQFVSLWTMIRQVRLSDQPDKIVWRFTEHGNYTVRSAYSAQFLGSFADGDWTNLWKGEVENKCKLFAWLLQNKLWTTDQIVKHGGDTNKTCSLCHTQDETTLHMVARCPYSRAVWHGLREWIGVEL
jgi:hypothetical protein